MYKRKSIESEVEDSDRRFFYIFKKIINFFGLWTLFFKFHNNTTKHLYYHHDVNFLFFILFYFILCYFILSVGGSSAPLNHGKSAAVKGGNPHHPRLVDRMPSDFFTRGVLSVFFSISPTHDNPKLCTTLLLGLGIKYQPRVLLFKP